MKSLLVDGDILVGPRERIFTDVRSSLEVYHIVELFTSILVKNDGKLGNWKLYQLSTNALAWNTLA